MKYAVNHHWKFESYQIAWLCGWMQSFNVIIVELVNFAALLTNFTIIEIIRNFLALVVISQFDEYFFSTVRNEPLAEIVDGDDHYEEFLKIQRTTSNRASRIKTMLNNQSIRSRVKIVKKNCGTRNKLKRKKNQNQRSLKNLKHSKAKSMQESIQLVS